MIPLLHSSKKIERRFYTGEEPVLVECSDRNSYICKYSRFAGSAYKLLCELLGATLAHDWRLHTPDIAIVNIQQQHVPQDMSGSWFTLPSLGSRLQNNAIDITPSSIKQIPSSERLCEQLLRIALFDCWIANEDRNANNANLMYDVENNNLVAIDFGCSFNTATLNYPLSQLTETDSILSSDLFNHIASFVTKKRINQLAAILCTIDMPSFLHDAQITTSSIQMWETDPILQMIPSEWNINHKIVDNKLDELLSDEWVANVKENFLEILNDIINNG